MSRMTGLSREYFFDGPLPEAKDPPELSFHQRMEELPRRPEGQPIEDFIPDCGHSAFLPETVGVNPHCVRTLDLFVHEAVGRIPEGDPRSPREREPEEAEPIINPGSLANWDRLRGSELKVELRGRNAFEIRCVAEESENLTDPERQAHGRAETVSRPVFSCEFNTAIMRRSHVNARCCIDGLVQHVEISSPPLPRPLSDDRLVEVGKLLF
jgi:hypothetical protein